MDLRKHHGTDCQSEETGNEEMLGQEMLPVLEPWGSPKLLDLSLRGQKKPGARVLHDFRALRDTGQEGHKVPLATL